MVPANTIEYSVRNSGRRDIEPMGQSRARRARGRTVAPVSERRTTRWNGDPYEFDDGSDGHERDDGAAIRCPIGWGAITGFWSRKPFPVGETSCSTCRRPICFGPAGHPDVDITLTVAFAARSFRRRPRRRAPTRKLQGLPPPSAPTRRGRNYSTEN